jgi:hypothetical protein
MEKPMEPMQDDLQSRVVQYVEALARRGRPFIENVGGDGPLKIRWPRNVSADRNSRFGYSETDADPLLLVAFTTPNALANSLLAEIERSILEERERVGMFCGDEKNGTQSECRVLDPA